MDADEDCGQSRVEGQSGYRTSDTHGEGMRERDWPDEDCVPDEGEKKGKGQESRIQVKTQDEDGIENSAATICGSCSCTYVHARQEHRREKGCCGSTVVVPSNSVHSAFSAI